MKKDKMIPQDVAKSAERQLIELKKAQNDKMQEMLEERNYIVTLKRTIQNLIYTAGTTYETVFPGAEGFIEGRIKSPDSIATKTRNEFTEILSEIKENPNINQQGILNKISEITFKDLIAFSVITTVPPKKFRIGNDDLNEKLNELAEELEATSRRISEHNEFIEINEQRMLNLSTRIKELKSKLNSMSKERGNEVLQQLIKDANETDNIEGELSEYLITPEAIEADLNDKNKELNFAKENVKYGERNLARTTDVYSKTLRELQYEMSAYFVSNLAKFATFKFWGTEEERQAKAIKKPGFRAVNTGYSVKFSNKDTTVNENCKIKFEAQGKGGLDYLDAEFLATGASYHEEQKTKDGLISKRTDMPDFTVIGAEKTERIEREVRREHQDINSIEDLRERNLESEYNLLKRYEKRIRTEFQSKYGDNQATREKVKEKMLEEFKALRENLIQGEIEKRINQQVDLLADSDLLKKKIQDNKELNTVYEQEFKKLSSRSDNKNDIEHMARVRVVYYAKEREITEYAKTSIPMFFRANLTNNINEEVMVYWFSTGESIYRYFYNKLNGLKDENGNYKYEPQEQQKRALLKLTGLFEENLDNFYTYDRNSGKMVTLDER